MGLFKKDADDEHRCPECGKSDSEHMNWCPSLKRPEDQPAVVQHTPVPPPPEKQ